MPEVVFTQVERNVWSVHCDGEFWGKMWQTLPSGVWGLIDENHRRYFLGVFLVPSKAKEKATLIVSNSYLERN